MLQYSCGGAGHCHILNMGALHRDAEAVSAILLQAGVEQTPEGFSINA